MSLKDLLEVASPIINSVVEVFVTPKLKILKDKFGDQRPGSYVPTEDHFKSYLERSYKRLAVVNTLVFSNSQKLLQEIYQPLTIRSAHRASFSKKITGYPEQIIGEFGNILITDTAGMGKSTLMKVIFLDIIMKKTAVPIFIELRRLSSTHDILTEIKDQLSSLAKQFDSDLLLELLTSGSFIIIFDGYDEISLLERDAVTLDIQRLVSKASNNVFLMTSRPEAALAGFGNFQEFRINPLERSEAFELLRKYDGYGEISSLLVDKINGQGANGIDEFLTNPLLVSLLFMAFEYKPTIPFKKHLFYRQVYDANFETHDLTKGGSYIHEKSCGLDIDGFHKILRYIGFYCMLDQKIEFTKDEILKRISDGKSFSVGTEFSESNFLADLLSTVPLFIQDGNYYRWAHKSLHEYFAAQFIYLDSKEKQKRILSRIYEHKDIDKFINVLDLYYDMDYKTFRNVIEVELLREYRKYCISSYQDISNEIDQKDIVRRRELTFLSEIRYFYVPKNSLKFTDTLRVHGVSRLDDRKLNSVFQELEKETERERIQFDVFLLTQDSQQEYFFVALNDCKRSLLGLLVVKNNPIVSITFQKPEVVKFSDVLKDAYVLHTLDDNPSDPMNSVSNFKNANESLVDIRLNNILINHNVAIETLELVEKTILKESEEDFLLDGM